jgi:hypothetical protein
MCAGELLHAKGSADLFGERDEVQGAPSKFSASLTALSQSTRFSWPGNCLVVYAISSREN